MQWFLGIKDSLGNLKFKKLSKLVKALLALAPDNAECKHGFNVSLYLLERLQWLYIIIHWKCIKANIVKLVKTELLGTKGEK